MAREIGDAVRKRGLSLVLTNDGYEVWDQLEGVALKEDAAAIRSAQETQET